MLCMILSLAMCITGIAPAMSVFAEDEIPAQEQTSDQEDAKAEDDAAKQADAEGAAKDAEPDTASSEEAAGAEQPVSRNAKAAPAANDADTDAEAAAEEEAAIDAAALIGDAAYASLKEAVEASVNGDTIVLQKDVRENVSVEGKRIVIDLNYHTWTAKGGSNRQFARLESNAELGIKNGTLSGGKSKGGEEAALHNNGGKLTLEDITLTKGAGEQIRNNNGTLVIKASEFSGNSWQQEGSTRYIIYNTGTKAKADISNSVFKNNRMLKGGIIYSGAGSSSTQHELRLTSCDIKNNVVNSCSINGGSYLHLYMTDTTVSENESTYTSSGYPAGLKFNSGWIEMKESAVYNNKAPSSVYDRDIYLYPNDIKGGMIPLPSEMSDHGKSLENYDLCVNRYSYVFTEPVTSNTYMYYREISVEPKDGTDEVAEYNGVKYTSIADAVKAMEGQPGTVRVLKSIALNETIEAHDGVVINLSGHTLTPKSTSRPILTILGGEVTVKNGNLKDGAANVGSAINTENTTLSVDAVNVHNCKKSAIYSRFGRTDDPERRKVEVKNCEFTANGSAAEEYAVNTAECDLSVRSCKFDGNAGGIRAYQSEGKDHKFVLEDSDFVNGTDQQVDIYAFKGSNSVISNCTFSDNKLKNSDAVIKIEARSSGSPVDGGEQTFNNCTITNNSGAKISTILAETGISAFNNCLISGNSGKDAGAIYVDPTGAITLKDTVVKNNKSSSPTSNTSGGIVLRSAQYVLVTPSVNGSQGSSSQIGFYAASLDMEGGAIYGNENGGTSPSADDLRVHKECVAKVPEVSEMKDGDYDFTGLFWKNDAKTDPEQQPAAKDSADRYYSVGIPGGMKQVYIDGVNGDDSGIGTKESPVKTIEVAVELAKKYKCKNILVLNKVSVGGDEETEGPKTIDFEGITVKRDSKYLGLTLLIKEGADLTFKNLVMEGDAAVWAKAEDSLIRVEKGAKLTLDEGTSLSNNGYNRNYGIEKGGAVHCLGELVMNDGAQVIHNYAVTGGGICVDGGRFIMNGGLIDDNVALFRLYSSNNGGDYNDSNGGGVCLINGAYMEMRDGVISNNEALHSGGGISLGTMSTNTVLKGTNRLYVTGGVIDSNVGYVGAGGIFVQCNTEAYISAGSITNNYAKNSKKDEQSYFAGGGIYVNGYHNSIENALGIKHGKLYMTNVEIANNTAEWEGGAIGLCASGHGNVAEVKGTVIYDNYSKGNGNNQHKPFAGVDGYNGDYDVFFDNIEYIYDYSGGTGWTYVVQDTLEYSSFLGDKMLNGGDYNWTDDNGDYASIEDLHKINKRTRLNTEATASDPDVKASVAKATVHINGNRSGSNGGGIGCNGEIYIGQLPGHIDIPVEKNWADEGHEKERPESIKIDLYRDGELYASKEVSADENGEWNTTFCDLPEYHTNEKGEQTEEKYEYEIKEDIEYKPAGYDKKIEEVYGDNVTCNEDGSWTVVNAYMEVLSEYEEPEETEETETTKVLEEYEEPDKPKVLAEYSDESSEKSKGTKTGDNAMTQLWIMILITSAAVLAAAAIRRRRSENR